MMKVGTYRHLVMVENGWVSRMVTCRGFKTMPHLFLLYFFVDERFLFRNNLPLI